MKIAKKDEHRVVVYDYESGSPWVGGGEIVVGMNGDKHTATFTGCLGTGTSQYADSPMEAIKQAIERAGYIALTFQEAKEAT